ncbi:expressed unknown protein [Seminavis robusta]|uniref:Uncharacterized protein n=1 Tax=Seminavis robusta TaxID=568900 RepID=A0A9N8HNX1_9STRA|nr:expressed unknown protein [Seminavis robusta]|eukprot:Sro1032_g233570.1 n/a (184) ;mRNA; f:24216-24767
MAKAKDTSSSVLPPRRRSQRSCVVADRAKRDCQAKRTQRQMIANAKKSDGEYQKRLTKFLDAQATKRKTYYTSAKASRLIVYPELNIEGDCTPPKTKTFQLQRRDKTPPGNDTTKWRPHLPKVPQADTPWTPEPTPPKNKMNPLITSTKHKCGMVVPDIVGCHRQPYIVRVCLSLTDHTQTAH